MSNPSSPSERSDTDSDVYELEMVHHDLAFAFRSILGSTMVGAWLGQKRASINGASKYARLALHRAWYDKRKPTPPTGNPMPASLKYGLNNEAHGVTAYRELMDLDESQIVRQPGFKVWHGPYEGNERELCGAAPDALIGADGLCEVKCPYSMRNDPDQRVHLDDKWLTQVQMQMEAYDRQWCDIIVWQQDWISVFRVLRDEKKLHTEYSKQVLKRGLDAADPTLGTELQPAMTFLEAAWPEIQKFDKDAPIETLGCDLDVARRIDREFKAMREKCVQVPAITDDGWAWVSIDQSMAASIERTDPAAGHRVIDRFSNPAAAGDMPLKSIWLNIRWLGMPMTRYWVWEEGKQYPRGGFIHSQHYTYYRLSDLPNSWNATRLAAEGKVPMPGSGLPG